MNTENACTCPLKLSKEATFLRTSDDCNEVQCKRDVQYCIQCSLLLHSSHPHCLLVRRKFTFFFTTVGTYHRPANLFLSLTKDAGGNAEEPLPVFVLCMCLTVPPSTDLISCPSCGTQSYSHFSS